MKKKCPICNKMIIDDIQGKDDAVVHFTCPKCNGDLLLFPSYKARLEARDFIQIKCPVCEESIQHNIAKYRHKREICFFTDFHQTCPSCGTTLVVEGCVENGMHSFSGSMANVSIDTFAPFTSAHYVIAVAAPFASLSKPDLQTLGIAKSELKKLLALPDDEVLSKVKRHKDYSVVSKSIRSYIVSSPTQVEDLLPKFFSAIYSSGNLLAKKEKTGDFLKLLETLIFMTNTVKDVCGKAAITDSVVNDLGNIPAEIPHKWTETLRACQDSPGCNMFSSLYDAKIYMDLGDLAGFQAERHLYNPCDEQDIIETFKASVWYLDYGCIHPASIIEYAAKNAVNPDEVKRVLDDGGIPTFELDRDHINWRDYAEQFPSLKLKENALGFPAGKSIRQALGNQSKAWTHTRQIILKAQNNTCQICGYQTDDTKHLHAHEVWEDGPKPYVLRLAAIQLLCNHCHDCKHIGQFLMRQSDVREARESYDRMVMHMAKVNDCSPEVIYAYHLYRQEQIQKQREEKIRVKLKKNGDAALDATADSVQYVIGSDVPNRDELHAALKERGLVYSQD